MLEIFGGKALDLHLRIYFVLDLLNYLVNFTKKIEFYVHTIVLRDS